MQGDDSPIGPLRLQLPDLTASAIKDKSAGDERVTVLLDEQAGSSQEQDEQAKQNPVVTDGDQSGDTAEAQQADNGAQKQEKGDQDVMPQVHAPRIVSEQAEAHKEAV